MDTINPITNDQLAPGFTLTDLKGIPHSLADLNNRIVIINFWSSECPVSQRCDFELLSLLEQYGEQVVLRTIASNANETLEQIQAAADERALAPVLADTEQKTARAYHATVTPHLFVLDQEGYLRYQGGFDDVTFRNPEPSRNYLWEAVDAVLVGERPEPHERPAYGCTIVYQAIE